MKTIFMVKYRVVRINIINHKIIDLKLFKHVLIAPNHFSKWWELVVTLPFDFCKTIV